MKIIKCDICGKVADVYYQAKFRRVTDAGIGKERKIELCEPCYRVAADAITGRKNRVNNVS